MLVSLFPWLLYIAAWLCTLFYVHNGAELWTSLLYFVVIFNAGIQGMWASIGHLAFPEQTAAKIGWSSNGFQIEIGFANLAIGVCGLLTYLFAFWAVPIGAFTAIYYAGCAYNHIKERFLFKNNAPCNSGPMLYSTIVTVITIVVCIFSYIFVKG